jgi:uncharacterized protein YjlB
MQSCLFIGGKWDGLNVPVAPDVDVVQLPAGAGAEKDNYIAEMLTIGAESTTIYRHEDMTPEDVIDCLVESYKAWAVNRPGGRR